MVKLNSKDKSELEFGKCGDCRLCWDSKINNISYKYH